MDFIKYPKTYALERLSPSDKAYPFPVKAGQVLVIEEKMDGTQVGLYFDENDQPVLQSRGTIISAEPEFAWLKAWIWEYYEDLYIILGQRYIAFGEWLWAKHSLFYDQLPHYWLEFDVYDRETGYFLSTSARQTLFKDLVALHPVRVIKTLEIAELATLYALIGRSAFISEQAFARLAPEVLEHTEQSGLMEGLYIKLENEHQVLQRYKLVRPEFIDFIIKKGEHWRDRASVKNQLKI